MGRASVLAAVIVAGAICLTPEPAFAQGCAMCRRALASPEGQQMAAAFRSGILVLLAAPFSLVGIVAALVVRLQRKREATSSARTSPN